jgi:LysM repeat protein
MSVALLLAACLGQQAPPRATVEPTPATTPSATPIAALDTDLSREGPTVESLGSGEISPAAETPAESPVTTTTSITLRHGETLDQLARQCGTTVEALAGLNGIGVRTELRAGERLTVPATEDLDARREAAFDLRLNYFLEARGGLVGVATRDVKTGDTAWAIARQEGLPTWVLAAFNRQVDLGRLGAGDILYLPVIGDSVQAVAEVGEDSGIEE